MEDSVWEKPMDEVYSFLASSEKGLSAHEVGERLKKHGKNDIRDKDKREWLEILLAQFSSPLLLILLAASVISGLLGDFSDTAIIIVITLVTVLLGFLQEYKSEKEVAELKKYFSYHAVVMRVGVKEQIDSRELVPGDIVFVGLGDIVPADMRIIETGGVIVNESVLTGESREVRKTARGEVKSGNPQDVSNGLFMGSTVIDGYARCIVVSTGHGTFFGKTASVFSSKVPESDFQIGMKKFGNSLLKVIGALTLFVFLVNV
ncbi:MAG: HAD-IC family P-type ATPase, partial [Candidatus Micrarchaeota archaeon]